MIRKKRHKWVQAEQQLRAAAATDDEGLQVNWRCGRSEEEKEMAGDAQRQ
jgi:hypothetical protein